MKLQKCEQSERLSAKAFLSCRKNVKLSHHLQFRPLLFNTKFSKTFLKLFVPFLDSVEQIAFELQFYHWLIICNIQHI